MICIVESKEGTSIKRFFILLLSVLIASLFLTTANADSASEDLSWPNVQSFGYTGASIVESIDYSQGYSHLYVWDGNREVPCDGLTDAVCSTFNESKWGMVRILPPCSETVEADECIEGVSVTSGEVTKEATLLKSIPGPSWKANDSIGLISGGTESIWSNPFSSDPNVGFQIKSRSYYSNQTQHLDHQQWKMDNFTTQINPYRIAVGDYSPVQTLKKSAIPKGIYSGDFTGDWAWISPPAKCLWTETGECGVRTTFGDVTSLSLRIRLSNNQTGWLAGRLVDPKIAVSKVNDKENLLTISAAPADTAYVEAWTTTPTSDMLKFAQTYAGGEFTSWRSDIDSEFLSTYHDYLKDTVTKIIPTWSVTDAYGSPINVCLKSTNSFVGVVTTNATTYQSTPPDFSDGTLNYSVGSLHFKPDGSLNKGTYDLVLNSQAARCLYNFTNAPIGAVISITTSAGLEDVAVTSINEKDGWLYLSARGFTYSNPTIKVKLTQALPTPVPTMIAQASPKAVVKSTITCAKGKSSKKIMAVKPKCPVGYKRK